MIKYIIEIYLKIQLQFHSAVFQYALDKAQAVSVENLLINVFGRGISV
jgi:hypothetical protein